jgi:hypothetical protein
MCPRLIKPPPVDRPPPSMRTGSRTSSASSCCLRRSADGDRPIINVLPLLKERLEKINRHDLIDLVNDVSSYRRMMSQAGDRFSTIIFTQVDVDRMRESDPAAFRIVTRWLVDCVGVQNPVLTIEVRNLSSESILITSINYLVHAAYIVLGGEAGPLTPAYTYTHTLPHKQGAYRRPLVPAFSIAPNGLGAFNVVVRSADAGAGQAWILQLRIVGSNGSEALSDEFQLIMSKLE